uniref:Uncharacterized protein n=1 Tax=Aegilops tauschii subsp. strangulata TaxID=200361 RepID=A0A452XKW2_AEGTS
MKRLCMSELLGPRTINQLRPVRRAGLVSLLQSVLHHATSSSVEVMDLTAALIRLSNTSIMRMMASNMPKSVLEEAQALVKSVTELVGAFNVEDYVALCRGWDLQGLGRRSADVHCRFEALLEDMMRHKQEAREARRMCGEGEGEQQRLARHPAGQDEGRHGGGGEAHQGEDQSLRHGRGHCRL